MGPLTKTQRSCDPPNYILHGNRCGWLGSEQNPKEGQKVPFQDWTTHHGDRGPSCVFSPWEVLDRARGGALQAPFVASKHDVGATKSQQLSLDAILEGGG